MTQNKSFILQVVFLLIIVAGTWYLTGQSKDNWYRSNSKHTSDTTVVHDSIPQPPRFVNIYVPYEVRKTDTVYVDSAYARLTKEQFRFIAAPVDTVIQTDTVATSHILYNPLTRVLGYGLQLAPIHNTTITIHDSITTPYPVHDSWLERATYVGIGVTIPAIIILLRGN